MLDMFVLRDEAGILRGFENYCPHAGGPLNMFPDAFFARDGRSLICTRHGAKFDPSDGACFQGPCSGTTLHPVAVEVDAVTGELYAAVEELESVCIDGFGAFIVCDAGSAEANGPAVVRPEPPPPPRPRAKGRTARSRANEPK
jgi:nitrite reductase/ring-hydroxylating ferredoxin subunit